MSLIFATQLTAVATAALAVFAIVTAVFAFLAYRKQSKEVSDMARMLEVQSERLTDQREINALQSEELRDSLAERARQRRIAEREQANDVGFAWWPSSHVLVVIRPPYSQPRDIAMRTEPRPKLTNDKLTNARTLVPESVLVIDNASRRRILSAACRIEPSEGSGVTLAAEYTGQLTDAEVSAHRGMINDPDEGSTVPLIRAGSQYGFLLRFDLEAHPDARLAARFTDDAGLHWQIDQDLHLQLLHNRDDW
jgi:hypothetical protein